MLVVVLPLLGIPQQQIAAQRPDQEALNLVYRSLQRASSDQPMAAPGDLRDRCADAARELLEFFIGRENIRLTGDDHSRRGFVGRRKLNFAVYDLLCGGGRARN